MSKEYFVHLDRLSANPLHIHLSVTDRPFVKFSGGINGIISPFVKYEARDDSDLLPLFCRYFTGLLQKNRSL